MSAQGEQNENKKIAVVGGGLVGCLAACYLAKRNFDVTLYEYRSDIRKMKVVIGRSINMAMSVRGREGLKRIGAEESITSQGIEMHSRMIHDTKGNTGAVPYGKKNQSILSIDRRYLNELLLNEAEKYSNIKIVFNYKLLRCNTNTGELEFENLETKEVVNVKSDLIIGCDGSYSSVRQSLMKEKPIEYSQSYSSGYYLELVIPAVERNGTKTFAMPPNHLHIWPRGQFMLIALPNQDCSFTVTLFMQHHMFEMLKTNAQLLEFFEKYFSDALDLIGRKTLVDIFFTTKPSPLISIKCTPHHGKKCVLLGDSAHSMVPFYGQGMNSGFEDVVVFCELLDKIGFSNLDELLSKYSEFRVPDAHAICDLAVANYEEMRYLVTTRGYKFRKQLDNFLNVLFPKSWIPLYTMVTFTRIRYSEVIQKRKTQDQILDSAKFYSTVLIGVGLASLATYKLLTTKAIKLF